MALLDALSTLAPELGLTLSALHVHHGLSANADAWARFCGEQCARRGVPLTVQRAAIRRAAGESLEAQARAARYAALAAADADVVALAHHADDQAETLLLQLLRGAGPDGLAAMPARRSMRRSPAPAAALPRVAARGHRRLCGGPRARLGRRRIEREHRREAQLHPPRRSRRASPRPFPAIPRPSSAPPRTRPKPRGSSMSSRSTTRRARSPTTPLPGRRSTGRR